MVVTKMPCLPSSIFKFWSTAMSCSVSRFQVSVNRCQPFLLPANRSLTPEYRLSMPRQHALCPCPGKPLNKEKNENQHRRARRCAQTSKCHRKRQQKNSFHIEDEKNDAVKVVRRAKRS